MVTTFRSRRLAAGAKQTVAPAAVPKEDPQTRRLKDDVTRLERNLERQIQNPRKDPARQAETVRALRNALERAKLRLAGREAEAERLRQEERAELREQFLQDAAKSAQERNIQRVKEGKKPQQFRVGKTKSTFLPQAPAKQQTTKQPTIKPSEIAVEPKFAESLGIITRKERLAAEARGEVFVFDRKEFESFDRNARFDTLDGERVARGGKIETGFGTKDFLETEGGRIFVETGKNEFVEFNDFTRGKREQIVEKRKAAERLDSLRILGKDKAGAAILTGIQGVNVGVEKVTDFAVSAADPFGVFQQAGKEVSKRVGIPTENKTAQQKASEDFYNFVGGSGVERLGSEIKNRNVRMEQALRRGFSRDPISFTTDVIAPTATFVATAGLVGSTIAPVKGIKAGSVVLRTQAGQRAAGIGGIKPSPTARQLGNIIRRPARSTTTFVSGQSVTNPTTGKTVFDAKIFGGVKVGKTTVKFTGQSGGIGTTIKSASGKEITTAKSVLRQSFIATGKSTKTNRPIFPQTAKIDTLVAPKGRFSRNIIDIGGRKSTSVGETLTKPLRGFDTGGQVKINIPKQPTFSAPVKPKGKIDIFGSQDIGIKLGKGSGILGKGGGTITGKSRAAGILKRTTLDQPKPPELGFGGGLKLKSPKVGTDFKFDAQLKGLTTASKKLAFKGTKKLQKTLTPRPVKSANIGGFGRVKGIKGSLFSAPDVKFSFGAAFTTPKTRQQTRRTTNLTKRSKIKFGVGSLSKPASRSAQTRDLARDTGVSQVLGSGLSFSTSQKRTTRSTTSLDFGTATDLGFRSSTPTVPRSIGTPKPPRTPRRFGFPTIPLLEDEQPRKKKKRTRSTARFKVSFKPSLTADLFKPLSKAPRLTLGIEPRPRVRRKKRK